MIAPRMAGLRCFQSPSRLVTEMKSLPKNTRDTSGTAIMEHFLGGQPLMEGAAPEADEDYGDGDPEVIEQIKELIDTRGGPAGAQDGGDIDRKRGVEGKR